MSTAAMARWIGFAVLIGAIGVALLLREHFDAAHLTTTVDKLGVWAPIGFIVAFAMAAVLFLPGAVLGLAGGALFGPLWGAMLNLAGGTLGAAVAFLIARHLAADWVRRRVGGRLGEIIRGVDAEGWRFVAFVRLMPIFPFNLANYALGLTRISSWQYLAATAICMIPGSAAYAWLGHAGAGATAGDKDAVWYGLLGLAIVAAIAFLPRLRKRFHGAISDVAWVEAAEVAGQQRRGESLAIVDVREPDEFAGSLGHIPGACNLPLAALVADPNQLARFHDRPIVLVCRTERRSARAAQALAAANLPRVSVLRGGMERWNALGLPIEPDHEPAPTQANAAVKN
jgi:uncharacterized membrane protein YdjX (TVP38/TMEM64 family)/rhodanese-related sulfurtransferase